MRQKVWEMQQKEVPLIPITQNKHLEPMVRFLDFDGPVDLSDTTLYSEDWVNFYRSDDWSATAYFYLDKPVSNLPELANVTLRTAGL